MTNEIEMTVRCKPWSRDGVAEHRVLVDVGEHPRVRVWDPVGKIYTVCHELSTRTQARIIRAAQAR